MKGVLWMLTVVCLLSLASESLGSVKVLVPPTIEECRSDLECDIAARILCEAGLIEWCLMEA